jgi:uracil-DNA glycosylase
MNIGRFFLIFSLIFTFTAEASFKTNSKRGSLGEYDPGPAKDSIWVPLFGSVPNYRAYSKAILGAEKFRWNVGPMWYRGRLGENEVKVLVVGQEGAQDENTSNRTFTGGTGTKTQNMLNGLGFDRSYVFLNTFVYTIFGQRCLKPLTDGSDRSCTTKEDVDNYMFMEQGEDSAIVRYRHQLMDYMAQYNSKTLSMMVGVGGGGKDSLVTWIKSRGGKCKGKNVNTCDTTNMKINKQEISKADSEAGAPKSVVPGVRYLRETVKLKNKTLVVGVPHPGMAKFPGGAQAVASGFKAAAKRIQTFIKSNKSWLSGKSGTPETDIAPCSAKPRPKPCGTAATISRLNSFRYKNSPVPHRDFAFGTMWRLGDGGTNTNRWGQDSIQVYGKNGKYGDKSSRYDKSTLGSTSNTGNNEGLPWEPQRWNVNKPNQAKEFDYGPCGNTTKGCKLSKLMMGWPDFTKLKAPQPISHSSFGFGPTYRGNVEKTDVIVLADQYSHDDMFTARALTGSMGQKLQSWLQSEGYSNTDSKDSNNYVIIRTLPVDTLGMDRTDLVELATNDKVVDARNAIINEILKKNPDAKLVSVGTVAAEAAIKTGLDFQETLSSRDLPSKETAIPRIDLPYSTRYAMGTTGDRALRGTSGDGAYYRFWIPRWALRTKLPAWDEFEQ